MNRPVIIAELMLADSLKRTSDGKGLVIKDNSAEVQDGLKRLKDYGVQITQGPDGALKITADFTPRLP